MNPQQSFTILTRDHHFQVMIFGAEGARGTFAEFCGTAHGCERMTRVGIPPNLVFPDDLAATEWLLKACLADIIAVAGSVRSVRADRVPQLAA